MKKSRLISLRVVIFFSELSAPKTWKFVKTAKFCSTQVLIIALRKIFTKCDAYESEDWINGHLLKILNMLQYNNTMKTYVDSFGFLVEPS